MNCTDYYLTQKLLFGNTSQTSSNNFKIINTLSNCSWTRTQNHLFCKWIANGWVFVYKLNGSGFESSCSHLNFRFCTCFEQGVPWHSGLYTVWIHSETHAWHDKNLQSLTHWLIISYRARDLVNHLFKLILSPVNLNLINNFLFYMYIYYCFLLFYTPRYFLVYWYLVIV